MSSAIRIAVLAAALTVGGCATNNPKDPFEPYNRVMFNFNDTIDRAALKPAAEAYTHLPSFVQTGIGNFFGNLADVWTAVNNLLQGKFENGVTDVMRVAINTTFGLGGLIDISTDAGLPKHKEDFGQTLGYWGVTSGPYFVLPIFGPSTIRDALATPVDLAGDPWGYVYPVSLRNTGYAVRTVDLRASVLGASNLLEEAALDRYTFVRDAYLQRRESIIRDGESPRTSYEDEEGADVVATHNIPSTQNTEPAPEPLVKTEQNVAEGNDTDSSSGTNPKRER